ncbi:MAG: DUF1045 domain-containing protein [Pseudomonadota bacterium]
MRYAVYLTPPKGSALAQNAALWLGRDAFSGAAHTPAAPEAANASVPARYGFHATMRAPFRLKPGESVAAIHNAVAALNSAHAPVTVTLKVACLSRFVALIAHHNAALVPLHEAALHAAEPFRAPLTEAERARRKPAELDARGLELLDRYGYPHILERFLFHMTLSGPLEEAAIPAVEAAANAHFATEVNTPLNLVFAVFAEAETGGPFTILKSPQPTANPS